MKLKTLLFLIPLLTLTLSLFAKNTLPDSVGVENIDGKKVIIHKLDPKDNYYSIGRRYGVKPAAIIQFNNNVALHVGATIKVPTDRPFTEITNRVAVQTKTVAIPVIQQPKAQTAPPQVTANTSTTVPTQQYKVSAGETLYAIAKRFNSTVEDITRLNNLTSTTVVPGQILLVKSGTAEVHQAPAPVATLPHPIAKRDSTIPATTMQDSADRRMVNANRFGLYEKNEKGVATWIDDTSLDPTKKLALHRTAPIGTVIKIINPMTSRTTFAKVVGRINDSETTRDVIIVFTKNVAESIGGLDKRFHVNISYGSPNE